MLPQIELSPHAGKKVMIWCSEDSHFGIWNQSKWVDFLFSTQSNRNWNLSCSFYNIFYECLIWRKHSPLCSGCSNQIISKLFHKLQSRSCSFFTFSFMSTQQKVIRSLFSCASSPRRSSSLVWRALQRVSRSETWLYHHISILTGSVPPHWFLQRGPEIGPLCEL